MSEVNPLIAAILATAIIEPRPKKDAARRAVEAYREMLSELGKVAQEPAPKGRSNRGHDAARRLIKRGHRYQRKAPSERG
jgi:hypothetical protein